VSALKAALSIAIALPLALCPLAGGAQTGSPNTDWATEKQAMIDLAAQHDTAWALYQALERDADNPTHTPDEVPDWSGVWHRDGTPWKYDLDREGNVITAKLKGEYREMMEESVEQANAGLVWDPHAGCGQPRGYPGMLKHPRPHEFAVTPQQTWHIVQERDEIRRIYTDGRGHTPPDWAYDTPHGDSIGFWDGDRLIAHTQYTDGGWIGRVQPYFSNQLEGVGIWQKIDDDTIQADVWIYDPEALEEAWYTRQTFTRLHQVEGSPIRLAYFWNCDDPNNIVVPTEDGGTTFLDFDFTDVDDPPTGGDTQ